MRPPKITDAPGLTWRRLKHGWECRWRARTDLIQRGYRPKYARLFAPTSDNAEPGPVAEEWIRERANALQDDMLTWAHGGIEPVAAFNGTWASLIRCYKTDPDSPYGKKRYNTRQSYDVLCKCIIEKCGNELLEHTDARRVMRIYESWANAGKIAMGHSVIGMMRTVTTFGATMLKGEAKAHCRELKMTLHDLRFTGAKPRDERLTADMAEAIIALSPSVGRRSIGLGQAFQFDLMLRQKDVIGEWVPVSEPGISDVIDRNEKWLRGLRWEEIDQNLRLVHTTSKRQKEIDVDLNLAPMVMEQLRFIAACPDGVHLTRAMLPVAGPIVVNEKNLLPWRNPEYRRLWRKLANDCGVPKTVRNMDSRAGAISEATDAGAELEHVRHAATHSDIAMTQRYSRGSQDKVAKVMKLRAEQRGKK
jgi:hypothetical protein